MQVFVQWELFMTGHVIVCRCAAKIKDELELVEVALASKYGFTDEHFTENTSGTISIQSQQFQCHHVEQLTQLPTCQLPWCIS